MKTRSKWISGILVAGGAVSAGLSQWHLGMETRLVEPNTSFASSAVPPLIVTSNPGRHTFSADIPCIGVVQSQASIELLAQLSGRVETIEAKDQSTIEAGDTVVQLGGHPITLQRDQLQASIESLKPQLNLADRTAKRREDLLKQGLSTNDEVAAAQYAQLQIRAQLRDTQLTLATLELQTTIAAPMAGTFTNRRASPGQIVNAGDVIGEIIDPDHLRIVASLFPPSDVELKGKSATIRVDENDLVPGIVLEVLPQMGDTGAAIIWIESPQIDFRLHPGQTVGGSILVEVRPEALAVPESAIVYDSMEYAYAFIEKDGGYSACRIRLGLTQDGWVEVLSGLKKSQSIVTKGAYELFYQKFSEQFKVED